MRYPLQIVIMRLGVALLGAAALAVTAPATAQALTNDQNAGSNLNVNHIDDSIPDDAELVSNEYAQLADGTLVDVETGATVTDPQLVGTETTQPDPLAVSGGESFDRISVGEVRELMATPSTLSLDNSGNGAYWGTHNGTPAFFSSNGTLFCQQAKGVIDVSNHNGIIDWEKAKADGVEGAIIRIGYGWNNVPDIYAERNISECKRLGIPFGVYLYSYAENASNATEEGLYTVELLREFGVSPSDLAYPVFYDLEAFTWTGHQHPTTPSQYEAIINNWYAQLHTAGYTDLGVYSYQSYLQSALASGRIYSKVRWVANYGSTSSHTQVLAFDSFGTNDRGWQYTSSGRINGITGAVDLNAFGIRNTGNEYYFSNEIKGGEADAVIAYGRATDTVFSGDWDGNATDTLAVRRGRFYYFKNSISGGEADQTIAYGREDDEVYVGDWDGDGKDTLVMRRDNLYYFKNSISGGEADVVIAYGRAGDEVLVGDWDGDGKDTLAIRRGNVYYIKNSISGGEADEVVGYGRGDDDVLVGDWDADGKDTLAVRRGNQYYIKNTIANGEAEEVIAYGKAADSVLIGDWDGDSKDTLAVRR